VTACNPIGFSTPEAGNPANNDEGASGGWQYKRALASISA
jgi:hypothetical protein